MSTYLDFAKEVAHAAGDIMLKHFTIGIDHEIKPDLSPVTIADKEVNSRVIAMVKGAFPDHSVRGEEESNHVEGDEYVWVCDPIDGTIPYSLGIPTNVFSLALVRHGVPICAVVYDPYMKRLYTAEKDKGAYLNDEPIRVSDGVIAHNAAVAMGNHDAENAMKVILALRTSAHHKQLRVFQYHSDVYAAMAVATGQFAFYVSVSPHPHDNAASKLIIEEAGGKVTDLGGKEQRYDSPINGAIISNGVVHNDVLEMMQQST